MPRSFSFGLLATTNLMEGLYQVVAEDVPADAPSNVLTNPAPTLDRLFYRIELQ